ncbi:MAG: hypothetical protein NTW87_19770 [Planctomycetota bacterium]|nr:hypothetical protein [Planctomycetota bacterium]
MAVFDLFSKRQKRVRGEVPDVYSYESIPEPLRVQIIQIWDDTLGGSMEYRGSREVVAAYAYIVRTLRHEYGCFILPGSATEAIEGTCRDELRAFLWFEKDCEKLLDVIELSFLYIDAVTRKFAYLCRSDCAERADAAIEDLNARFKEHGVGYQYVSGKIIRVDSELVHSEVVKPALALLHQAEYAGAEAEFLKAHEFYRHGDAQTALTECGKAFESTMKVICGKRKWTYDPTATSSALLDVCFGHHLIPKFWASHFSALRSTLESGVPTGRNKLSAHGQGAEVRQVPMYMAAYVLHMTAAAIVFLVEAERAMP